MISKERIKLLPVWCITETRPAFYDIDSKAAVGQTARLYGAMRELQEDYNNYVNEINTTITTFINDVNVDQEEFINSINKIMHDYIAMLDEKLKLQDKEIEETIVYIKENTEQALKETIMEMNAAGELNDVIVTAFDNLGGRVITLENEVNSLLTDHETFKETVTTNFESVNTNLQTINETLHNMKAITLYEDLTGSGDFVDCSQNLSNFDLIEVYFQFMGKYGEISTKFRGNATDIIVSTERSDGTAMYTYFMVYKVENNRIKFNNGNLFNNKDRTIEALTGVFYIQKVIGYRLHK